jgi:hypothetical protein
MTTLLQSAFPRSTQRSVGLLCWLVCHGAFLGIQSEASAEGSGDITAVSSRVSENYVRAKLPNGSFAPETYAFGKGGFWAGTQRDETIDTYHFIDVARTIAVPLARQNYLPANDPNKTKLVIMVYWGRTAGTAESPNAIDPKSADEKLMFRDQFDRLDFQNARLLGYDSEGVIGTDYGRGLRLTALHDKTEDLTEEIEDDRYFVVLMAYDFQLLWKHKKHELLWETRFSIREHRNDFRLALPAMAKDASRYFGQDSKGLIRKRTPNTNIILGEPKVLGYEPEKK